MLAILETLLTFREILLGAQIHIYTDHKNITQPNLSSQRILKWHMVLQEFAPLFHFKPGHENIGADALSRLPMMEREKKQELDDSTLMQQFEDSLINYPIEVDNYPMDFNEVRALQLLDAELMDKIAHQGPKFAMRQFGNVELACRRHDNNDQYAIVVPAAIENDVIVWYHHVCGHSGETRTYQTINNHLYIKNLKDKVATIVKQCEPCKRYKNAGAGYGELPPKDDESYLFDTVAVDNVGPWKITVPNVGDIVFHAMTMIDIASTLCEIKRIESKESAHMAMVFTNEWLSRYPRPNKIIFDQGTEFCGAAFQSMLIQNGIKPVPITAKNPQANAIVERLHLTIGDQLRTQVHHNPPANVETALEFIDTILASAQYAMRTAVHRTLRVSPGAMTFGRDMLLDIPVITDYNMIRLRRQQMIDEQTRRENTRRRRHDYQVGDQVLIKTIDGKKMDPRAVGPFTIEQVHTNGTVTIMRRPNVYERINIRRIIPYTR